MENNKQNSVLLIIIAVATLLVAVVGATFAYFTANNPTGSTAEVKTTSGKMEITFADGTDEIKPANQKNFQPSNAVLVKKEFTITGDNFTTAAPKTNGTAGASSSLVMPFIVSLNYKTTFVRRELHVLINRISEDSDYIPADKIKYGNGTAKTLSDAENKAAPSTLKGVAEFADYYDFAIGTGTNKGDETTDNLELVYGEFLDTQAVTNTTDKQVTFRLVMIFPDTESAQDYNTSATFNGILKVTTTADGSPRA